MKQGEKAIVLNARDNVATALADLETGSSLEMNVGNKTLRVKLTMSIPFGHKFSLLKIKTGESVVKYGEAIGTATADIYPGDYVHIHNVVSNRGTSNRGVE